MIVLESGKEEMRRVLWGSVMTGCLGDWAGLREFLREEFKDGLLYLEGTEAKCLEQDRF